MYVKKYRILEKDKTFEVTLLYCYKEETFIMSNIKTLYELFENFIKKTTDPIYKNKLCTYCALHALKTLNLINSDLYKKLIFRNSLEDFKETDIDENLINCKLNLTVIQ